jgi:hypothetical protein
VFNWIFSTQSAAYQANEIKISYETYFHLKYVRALLGKDAELLNEEYKKLLLSESIITNMPTGIMHMQVVAVPIMLN